jgi:glycerol-3-phosphate dehydrogenase
MRIGVIGGGAWGTALAQVAARGGEPVSLWAREPEVVAAINATHENPLFLAGVTCRPRSTRPAISAIWRHATRCSSWYPPSMSVRRSLAWWSAPRRWCCAPRALRPAPAG